MSIAHAEIPPSGLPVWRRRSAGCAGALIALVLACGCGDSPEDPRVGPTRKQLEDILEANKGSPAGLRRYVARGVKTGRRMLDTGEAMRRPALLIAVIGRGRMGVRMGLVYFDARFEVCGAIVENEGGLSRAFDLGYTESDRKWYARTILRDLVQPIAFPDNGSSEGTLPEAVVTPIQIPRSALRTRLMVSITDKHGKELSTVEVCVHPHLTATTKPSGKEG